MERIEAEQILISRDQNVGMPIQNQIKKLIVFRVATDPNMRTRLHKNGLALDNRKGCFAGDQWQITVELFTRQNFRQFGKGLSAVQ